ncbi:MAG: DUF58 domain-containing protein [FCB group bacterium]|nr:DUF58 domain-containing protein [FCB group bacterium]
MAFKTRQKLVWPGRYFSLVAFAVLLAAVNTGTNLLYLVAGALISFLVLSYVLSRWSLRRLTVSREAPGTVYRGEEFAVGLRIENRHLVTPAFSVRLESAARPGVSAGYILKIPARRAVLTRIIEVFERRGLHPLPDLIAVTGVPFGLVEARRRLGDTVDVLVYPRVHPVRPQVLDQLAGIGQMPKSISADGSEFFSLREYVRGDDIRRIAWRPSARLGTLVVREMEADVAHTVTLYLDTRRGDDIEFDDNFELAVEAVASLAVALLKKNFTVSLATPETFVPEAEGSAQARRILEVLARVEPVSDLPRGASVSIPAGRRQSGALLTFSGDAAQWSRRIGNIGANALDPREVFRV